jgi:Ca-activated chloride channel family protein
MGRTYRYFKSVSIVVSAAALASLNVGGGCAMPVDGLDGSAGFDTNVVGVTTGGQGDTARARAEIENGYIPNPDWFTVEGFLAEHDIPIPTPDGAPEIYAAFATAWRKPVAEPAAGVDIFVQLGSTIDTSQYSRRPQNLAVVVDRSGSMDDPASASDGRSKMDAVKQALHSLAGRLTADDRITLISFNTLTTIDLAATTGDQTNAIGAKIDALGAFGDTDLYKALKTGFEQAAANADEAHDSRVILFTDALPNAGNVDTQAIVALVRENASLGIGFTLMGIGQDFGADLASELAGVRLANAVYLANEDRIRTVFETDFDYMVTPAADDVKLTITIPDGVGIREVFGVPDYIPGSNGAQVVIPTMFFSAREGGGAIVVRLTLAETPTFEEPVTVGHVSLNYTLHRSGQQRSMQADVTLPADLSPEADPAWYSHSAARRAAVLLDTAQIIKRALRLGRDGNRQKGSQLIEDFLTTFDEMTLGLSDRTAPSSRGLSDERQLLEALQGTINNGRRYDSSYYQDYYDYSYTPYFPIFPWGLFYL